MKKILKRLAGSRGTPESADSQYFTTQFAERDDTGAPLVSWPERAQQACAEAASETRGTQLLQKVWGAERHAAALGEAGLKRLAAYLSFVQVERDREVIAQDEQGDFLLIVLEGTVAVDRVQPWGGHARLGEARPGDMLGEMSLLDAGTRFSACRTLTPCVMAVLQAAALDRMMREDPQLAATLLAALARRLSLRLRQSSARLSALLAQT